MLLTRSAGETAAYSSGLACIVGKRRAKNPVAERTVGESVRNPEALIACWSHTEIRVTGNQILNDRNLQLTALETIVATRNQAFLNLLPEEIRRSHFWDWKTPADLEREATARSSQ